MRDGRRYTVRLHSIVEKCVPPAVVVVNMGVFGGGGVFSVI